MNMRTVALTMTDMKKIINVVDLFIFCVLPYDDEKNDIRFCNIFESVCL